jgi:SAM-dependent methyltransferase
MFDSNTTNPLDAAYRETPPWEIGAAQPELLALLDEFPPASPALDLGCGTGELVLALARRGLDVLGVDASLAAIELAHAKADALSQDLRARVEFRVGDALKPTQLARQFATVVDTGFWHLFGPSVRENLVRELGAILRVGGKFYLLGFAFDSPMPNAPKQVREQEMRQLFTTERGWNILTVRAAKFSIRSARGSEVPALAACIERISIS